MNCKSQKQNQKNRIHSNHMWFRFTSMNTKQIVPFTFVLWINIAKERRRRKKKYFNFFLTYFLFLIRLIFLYSLSNLYLFHYSHLCSSNITKKSLSPFSFSSFTHQRNEMKRRRKRKRKKLGKHNFSFAWSMLNCNIKYLKWKKIREKRKKLEYNAVK